MNSCSVQEKVSHNRVDHSFTVLRVTWSWGHSYMGSRIGIIPPPHPRASIGQRHDLHRLESRCRPVHVCDGQPRRYGADMDDTRDAVGQLASNSPNKCFTYRSAGPPTH